MKKASLPVLLCLLAAVFDPVDPVTTSHLAHDALIFAAGVFVGRWLFAPEENLRFLFVKF